MARHRFNLLEALFLIATIALGMGFVRWIVTQTSFVEPVRITLATRFAVRAWWSLQVSIPLPGLLTIAIRAIRVCRPWPNLRRLIRQPGAVAGIAWSTVVGIRTVGSLIAAIRMSRVAPLLVVSEGVGSNQLWRIMVERLPWQRVHFYFLDFLDGTSIEAGLAVGAVWLIQAMGGRWRAEPSSVDRAGRWLGAYWIFLACLGCCWNPRVLL